MEETADLVSSLVTQTSSVVVQVQSIGGHPGQLTIDEIDLLISWILDGAPER